MAGRLETLTVKAAYNRRAMLRAMLDKEDCPALSNWSSIADMIHHHESAARAGSAPFTRYEVAAIVSGLAREGLVRRTRIGGEVRYRLTDDGRKAVRLAAVI